MCKQTQNRRDVTWDKAYCIKERTFFISALSYSFCLFLSVVSCVNLRHRALFLLLMYSTIQICFIVFNQKPCSARVFCIKFFFSMKLNPAGENSFISNASRSFDQCQASVENHLSFKGLALQFHSPPAHLCNSWIPPSPPPCQQNSRSVLHRKRDLCKICSQHSIFYSV